MKGKANASCPFCHSDRQAKEMPAVIYKCGSSVDVEKGVYTRACSAFYINREVKRKRK